uniref:CLAVATA3/ESR (CLE)-related protein 25-like n=1 Tax=Nicotiana sylvestris TaxID=4096 RepID=A0A1U7US52_NICSY|nr:PREDICTED: CLAVATA3/ESR (CLE)-related protein 25-like [Nicotiana sylvestris]
MENIRKFSKGFLGFLVLLGFVWLLLVGVYENEGIMKKNTKLMKTQKRSFHSKIDLNFVSRRRVPNGPDPIHNRRARSSRRPPGQASKGKLSEP